MKGALGLVLGAACATVIACSAGHQASTTPAVPASPAAKPAGPPSDDPHAKIQWYADQIDQQRRQLQIPEAVLPMSSQPMSIAPHVAQDNACHPAASTACGDVCRMSDSICDNTDKICKIADDIGDDEWAAGKCASAKQTCSDAHKRCCDCT